MSLRTVRNVAFAGMVIGATFAGATDAFADDPVPCKTCTASNGHCEDVGAGLPGMTQCTDTGTSCSLWGTDCRGGA